MDIIPRMKKIKSILFDLGNVLIKLDFEALERGFLEHAKFPKGSMIEYVTDSSLVNRFMEGDLNPAQFYRKTKKIFKMDINLTNFYRVWNSMFIPYPEMEELIKRVKAAHPEIKMVLLSNTNEAHYEHIQEEYSVIKLMDAHLVSHEFGAQKPDPAIYKEALRLAGTLPRDTFYADDRADLIEAARLMGIRAFQFTTHEKFREQLAKCGVIV